jgi:hypothetical protein
MVRLAAMGHKVLKAPRDLKDPSARRETKVNRVFKVKSDHRAKSDQLENLENKVQKAQKAHKDLRENPAPLVRKASKVLPVQLGLRERRVHRDLWVLWDPKDLKVRSVLLDLQVQMEHRVRRAKWVLKVLWVQLVLKGLLALRAIKETKV